MKIFLLDLWNDLREKRLWPVAVVLLAGLVAIPLVMAKKAEEPANDMPAPAAQTESDKSDGPAALAEVRLAELAEGSGSSLSSFDPSNPFAPPRKVLEAARDEATGTGGPRAETLDDGSGGSSGGDTGLPGDDTGDTGGDFGGDTGGDTGGTGGTKTVEFTYVIDATFIADGRRRKIKGMEKLDILPNEASPLLIFLGVTQNAGSAVFLVDSTLEAAGEGACKPSRADCAFLYLGAGSEHEFTNEDGRSFRLRVDEIRRVKVGGENGADASKTKKTKSASAAVGRQAPARRFAVPLLADLVSVSSGSEDIHDNDGDSR